MSLPSPGDPATGHDRSGRSIPGPGMRYAAAKVPEVTVWFWVAKLLTTGMGETTWDWAALALGPVPAIGLSGLGFVVAIGLQLRAPAYRAWTYWFAVLMVSVFGTTCADAVHVVLGVPYAVSTVVFLIAVLAAFGLWYRVEGTLSMHSIDTRRRELFYWSAVILTFALGTALGDLTATTLGIGYAGSILLFGVLFVLPFVARWATAANAVALFWTAYVMTRPFGASVADWVGVPAARGGVGIGTGLVSLVALLAIVAVVVGLEVGDRRRAVAVS
ncbi:hypothetical protein LQ327_17900 [Actinomycetospora endophytica]|uniref:Membrane-anchored protein n=1 Tax=Actinomycetospora endophytica TaxID=2291215 RepID=A0ABS8PCM2_9PSEU|nr:hypothetical protein [Actinomycetospora endophytica]MCD2195245.1 hypothetical protein [Actinomycetospora endophytica]